MRNLKKMAVVAGMVGSSALMALGTAQAHEGGINLPKCDQKASDNHCGQKREYRYTTEDGRNVHVVVRREGCAIKGSSTVDCSLRHP
ncbi:hypothetical protein [Streptomyces lomondensis]|uniref:Uncharacterized protein n=1 Tax=Streptomyces lomondensis TaxID=68229 RepID=A0ABQ2WYE4_9ACTN|nr:hypothetical protein [Streptomyces lomondensis]MCF0078701.1 hypothetical protein [Streptomyces lomondensis]GGW79405.1 hypothetical protein GCM10010383_03700 [Streptomyces lomondensis]